MARRAIARLTPQEEPVVVGAAAAIGAAQPAARPTAWRCAWFMPPRAGELNWVGV